MSHTKTVGTVAAGGAAAASLPVTGSPVATLVIAGIALVIGGLLFVRAGRFQRNADVELTARAGLFRSRPRGRNQHALLAREETRTVHRDGEFRDGTL